MAAPIFKFMERPEYELPQLLKTISGFDRSKVLDDASRETLEAAASHAYNTKESLLHGIESIGNLLSKIARQAEPLETYDLANIAGLIRHSAVHLQHVIDVEDQMGLFMRNDNELAEKGGAK